MIYLFQCTWKLPFKNTFVVYAYRLGSHTFRYQDNFNRLLSWTLFFAKCVPNNKLYFTGTVRRQSAKNDGSFLWTQTLKQIESYPAFCQLCHVWTMLTFIVDKFFSNFGSFNKMLGNCIKLVCNLFNSWIVLILRG